VFFHQIFAHPTKKIVSAFSSPDYYTTPHGENLNGLDSGKHLVRLISSRNHAYMHGFVWISTSFV